MKPEGILLGVQRHRMYMGEEPEWKLSKQWD